MPARERSRVEFSHEGTYYYAYNDKTTTKTFSTSSKVSDYVGNPQGENGFHSVQSRVDSLAVINHQSGSGKQRKVWSNYPIDGVGNTLTHLPLSVDSDGATVNRVLAGSGPLNPKVNLPLSLFELREVPRMLKHAGDILHNLWKKPHRNLTPSEIASATLAYQFGWAPIIEDIGKLLDFQASTQKRRAFLQRLDKGEIVRSRIGLGEQSLTQTSKVLMSSETGKLIYGSQTIHTIRSRWATCKWKKRSNTSSASNAMSVSSSEFDAFRSAFGLNRGHIPIAVWKALPWTWLFDWFANISDVLQASYNTMYFIPLSMCVMDKTISTISTVPTGDASSRVSSFSGEYATRRRKALTSPSIQSPLRIPILDPFKASVLGSLTVLRIRRAAN